MAADTIPYVLLFGLEVKDAVLYRRYREAMTPILYSYGGAFGYDFVVSQVLKSLVETPINRVFTMIFPQKKVAERFFSDATYLKIRAELFEPAVGSVSKLAEYDDPLC